MRTFLFVGLSYLVLLLSDWLWLTVTQGWDIYHLMDTGQRFLLGELAWTAEYVDKLLITQFLFVLPAFFGTLKVWFIISAVFVIFGSYACFVLVNHICPLIQIYQFKIENCCYYCILINFIYFVLPGHYCILMLFASSGVISLALLLKSSFKFEDRKISFLPFFYQPYLPVYVLGLDLTIFCINCFCNIVIFTTYKKFVRDKKGSIYFIILGLIGWYIWSFNKYGSIYHHWKNRCVFCWHFHVISSPTF